MHLFACMGIFHPTSSMKHDLRHRRIYIIPLFSTFCSDSAPCVLGPSCIETHCLCVRTAGCKVIWTHTRRHKHMWTNSHIYTHTHTQSFPCNQSSNSLYCKRIIECISCRKGKRGEVVHSELHSNHLNNDISILAPRPGCILLYESALGM